MVVGGKGGDAANALCEQDRVLIGTLISDESQQAIVRFRVLPERSQARIRRALNGNHLAILNY